MDIKKLENVSGNSLKDSKLSLEDDSASTEKSAHIQSCIQTAKCDPKSGLRRSNSEPGSLIFEIVSTRTVDDSNDKKHVEYTVLVKKDGLVADPHPAVMERRYTDFLSLYTNLKQAFPSDFAAVPFPRKLLTGNFAPDSITARSMGFEFLLSVISANHRIRDSSHFLAFMQNREMAEAKTRIESQRYDQAIIIVENAFRLLNKIQTDRHPAVLRTLCLLVACCDADNHSKTVSFADLALHRYEAVSDADLLRYYVPLLKLCSNLYSKTGKESNHLDERLADFKRRGMKVDGLPTLLEAVVADVFSS